MHKACPNESKQAILAINVGIMIMHAPSLKRAFLFWGSNARTAVGLVLVYTRWLLASISAWPEWPRESTITSSIRMENDQRPWCLLYQRQPSACRAAFTTSLAFSDADFGRLCVCYVHFIVETNKAHAILPTILTNPWLRCCLHLSPTWSVASRTYRLCVAVRFGSDKMLGTVQPKNAKNYDIAFHST